MSTKLCLILLPWLCRQLLVAPRHPPHGSVKLSHNNAVSLTHVMGVIEADQFTHTHTRIHTHVLYVCTRTLMTLQVRHPWQHEDRVPCGDWGAELWVWVFTRARTGGHGGSR